MNAQTQTDAKRTALETVLAGLNATLDEANFEGNAHFAQVLKELGKLRKEFEGRIARLSKPTGAKAGPSERGFAFADWFKSLIPATVRVAGNWREAWARVYDDLIRLDARTPEQIAAAVRAGRGSAFWATHFLSPAKLREKDRGGVCYFDKFLALAKAAAPASRQAIESGKHYAEPTTGPRKF